MNTPTIQMKRFFTVGNEVVQKGKDDQLVTTLSLLMSGLNSNLTATKVNGSEIGLPDAAMKALVHERGGFPWKAFSHPALTLDLRRGLLENLGSDKEVLLRLRDNTITNVFSADYSVIDNFDVAEAMIRLQLNGDIPGIDDLLVEKFFLSNDNRRMHMRLVAPNAWSFNLSDNDPYYGSIVISNNEGGEGSFTVQAAVQRLACFNYQIGETIVSAEHRLGNGDDLGGTIGKAFDSLGGAIGRMKDSLANMMDVSVRYPNKMLEKLIEDLALPNKAAIEARDYLVGNLENRNMYEVVQAVTWGSQQLSHGRSDTRWARRTGLEANLWNVSLDTLRAVGDGIDIEALYLSPEDSIQQAIATYLRNKAMVVDGVAHEVLDTTANEVAVMDFAS